MVLVKVKWGKEVLDIDVDLTAGVELFKAQIQSATMVPAEKMKIMGVKGGQLKDDADLTQVGITEGKALMLVGSAEGIKPPPEKRVLFAEDAPKGGHDAKAMTSNGLVNIGNTCYLASAIQMLRSVPPLRPALSGATHPVARQLGKLYDELDGMREAATPLAMWTVFMSAFPTFAQMDGGRPMQHDSQEALSSLLLAIHDRGNGTGKVPDPRIFGGEIEQRVYCVEEEDAATKAPVEHIPFTILPCNIDGEVATLEMGLEKGMEATFTARSDALKKDDAVFTRKGRFAALPEFMIVHFIRMAWRGDIKKKTKILKPIAFPMVLDTYTLCTEPLKKALDPERAKVMERRDAELERRRKAKAKGAAKEPQQHSGGGGGGPEGAADPGVPVEGPPDVPMGNISGFYELAAVVSHKGRDADGGHYVAWVKKNDGWLVYDDANVGPVSEEDIARLRGVGEAHIAYLLLYRTRDPNTGLGPLPL